MPHFTRIVSIAVIAAGLAACGSGTGTDIEPEAARAELLGHLHARASAGQRVSLARGFDEHLPNVTFQAPSGEIIRRVHQAVVGEVIDAEPGRAFWNQSGPGSRDGEQPESFDDPTAHWRTIHLVVEVAESFGDPLAERQVRIGIPISGSMDPKVLIEGAKALGRIFLPINQDGGLFDYDLAVLSTPWGGEYLTTIADDGTLALPVLEPDGPTGLLGKLRTLDDLRAAMAEPRVIPVDEPSPGHYERLPEGTSRD